MLTIDEIHDKAEAMERLAATVSEADAAAYRHVAMQWRLLEIQAVYVDAMRASVAPESYPAP